MFMLFLYHFLSCFHFRFNWVGNMLRMNYKLWIRFKVAGYFSFTWSMTQHEILRDVLKRQTNHNWGQFPKQRRTRNHLGFSPAADFNTAVSLMKCSKARQNEVLVLTLVDTVFSQPGAVWGEVNTCLGPFSRVQEAEGPGVQSSQAQWRLALSF